MKPIVIIPARGGSKGIPNKNLIPLNGKPLIQYTIEVAQTVFANEKIIVSTDSQNIFDFSLKMGLSNSFLRPDKYATDSSGMNDVLLNFCDQIQFIAYDTIVLLQPTSPLRSSESILNSLNLYKKYDQIDMLVSVKETKENPYFTLFEEKNNFLVKVKDSNIVRRQDCPKVYALNGAIYLINKKSFLKNKSLNFNRIIKFLMNNYESIDIDTYDDLKYCEYLLNR